MSLCIISQLPFSSSPFSLPSTCSDRCWLPRQTPVFWRDQNVEHRFSSLVAKSWILQFLSVLSPTLLQMLSKPEISLFESSGANSKEDFIPLPQNWMFKLFPLSTLLQNELKKWSVFPSKKKKKKKLTKKIKKKYL